MVQSETPKSSYSPQTTSTIFSHIRCQQGTKNRKSSLVYNQSRFPKILGFFPIIRRDFLAASNISNYFFLNICKTFQNFLGLQRNTLILQNQTQQIINGNFHFTAKLIKNYQR